MEYKQSENSLRVAKYKVFIWGLTQCMALLTEIINLNNLTRPSRSPSFIYKDTDTVYLCCFNKGHADVDV